MEEWLCTPETHGCHFLPAPKYQLVSVKKGGPAEELTSHICFGEFAHPLWPISIWYGNAPPITGPFRKESTVYLRVIWDIIPLMWRHCENIFFVVPGATAAVLKSTFAYIADINPPEKRFFRILLIEIGLGLGNLVGRIFFGWLIDTTGFIVPLAVYTALQLLILIYTVFFLPETIRKDPDVRSSTCASFFALPRLWLHDKDNIGQITIWVSFALIFTYG